MKKTERIDIRLSKQEKDKCEKVLNDINKTRNKKIGSRFLLMEFVDNYLNNNVRGLEIERNNLLKENEKDKEQINELTERITKRDIKIKEYNNRINNKTLYHENNFNDPNIIKAINRIKEIIFNPESEIKNYKDVPETLYLQMKDTFKIKNVEDLKNIVKYNFERWQQENIIITPEPKENESDNLNLMLRLFNRAFNGQNTQNQFNKVDKLKFLETNKEQYKQMCEKKGINFNEFKNEIIKEMNKHEK